MSGIQMSSIHIVVWYSDHHLNNGPVFKWRSEYLTKFSSVFKWHSNNGPFGDQTTFSHSNTSIQIPTAFENLKFLCPVFLYAVQILVCTKNVWFSNGWDDYAVWKLDVVDHSKQDTSGFRIPTFYLLPDHATQDNGWVPIKGSRDYRKTPKWTISRPLWRDSNITNGR